jgi:N-acetylated-alpha-linked acidic dipeptidase
MNRSLLILLMIFILQSTIAQNKKITGFYEKNVDKELSLESAFDKNLSKSDIGETIKKLSAEPHHISSPGDKKNAEYILSLFTKWGWEAKIETFYVLFPTPETRILEMTSP